MWAWKHISQKEKFTSGTLFIFCSEEVTGFWKWTLRTEMKTPLTAVYDGVGGGTCKDSDNQVSQSKRYQ